MDYRAISDKYRGFTLIEVLTVIAIVSLLAGISISAYSALRTKNDVDIAVMDITNAIRRAQVRAEQSSQDSVWGISISSDTLTVFRGESFSLRIPASDESTILPAGIQTVGLHETVFEKVSGMARNPGTISVTRDNETKNITINEYGTITYQ